MHENEFAFEKECQQYGIPVSRISLYNLFNITWMPAAVPEYIKASFKYFFSEDCPSEYSRAYIIASPSPVNINEII